MTKTAIKVYFSRKRGNLKSQYTRMNRHLSQHYNIFPVCRCCCKSYTPIFIYYEIGYIFQFCVLNVKILRVPRLSIIGNQQDLGTYDSHK